MLSHCQIVSCAVCDFPACFLPGLDPVLLAYHEPDYSARLCKSPVIIIIMSGPLDFLTLWIVVAVWIGSCLWTCDFELCLREGFLLDVYCQET